MENSAAADLILQAQTRLTTVVPIIRHVEEDLGQLEDYDYNRGRPAVSWPCALLSIEILGADDMGDNTQMINAALVVRLGLPPYSSGANWFPDDLKKKSLKIYDIEWEVYKALHGWKPNNIGYLCFRGPAVNEKREDPIRVRSARYETNWEEYSAQPAHTTAPLPPADTSDDI